ncbi:hypothetical protein Plec18167_006436 [Paecilomyces lecythidis]|uniref:F-box domain-containing protein n=1 Tax=Paecilomyces lecythidis TaxID=3004212 RepID=A0ABR3XBQ4_9EURO
MAPGPSLIQFWQTDLTRKTFLGCLEKDELRSLRLVCHEFAVQASPFLFAEIAVQFRSSTLTRPSRVAALERIGHHVKSLTFKIPHSQETFLPPLLDPVTGAEQTFVYEPHVHPPATGPARLSVPKYGSWEMTDMLVKQYPPLFHAATNIPSFIHAFTIMYNLEKLRITCEGQARAHRYRRSVVDYALISLRVAIEQSPLKSLRTLSLLPIHPGALLYLRPNMGFGASPASRKRWSQIRKLVIHMDSFPYIRGHPMDHLKLLHSYLQSFPGVKRFSFRWVGKKGPCPLSLATEPCLVGSTKTPSQACPKRCTLPMKPLRLRNLQYMELENAILDASQISSFILDHRHTIREFDFEDVVLRSGTWDDALAPLTRISGNDSWKGKQEETMEVPIILSPTNVDQKQIQRVIREEQRRKERLDRPRESPSNVARTRPKKLDLLWGGSDQLKRLLHTSMLSWRPPRPMGDFETFPRLIHPVRL